MASDFKCILGLHHYEVINTEPLLQAGTNIEIGKILINRCVNCGKIKTHTVRTTDRLY